MSVTDVCQLGLTKSYQVNQLFTGLDGAREPRPSPRSPNCAASSGSICSAASTAFPGLTEQVEHTLELVNLGRARRHAGVGARLWREAAAGDRAGARDLAEPAAARRAARRHEPARARRDRQAAEVDQPGPHHDRHRPRHGCAVRTGRARHRAAGRPGAGRGNAGGNQGQRRRCRKPISAACTECSPHEPARGQRPEQLLRGFPHPVRRRAARRAQRSGGAARPQRRRQEHDAEEPDGRA